MVVTFLKFVISVRGSQCDGLSRPSKNLATSLSSCTNMESQYMPETYLWLIQTQK